MSWRVVVLSGCAKADYKLDYLVVRTIDEVKRVHLSEIGVLIVESTSVCVTAYLLCEMIRWKIKVIFCGHEHSPCSELVPTQGSHDGSAKIRRQLRWAEKARGTVWTGIVREKLRRQRAHLLRRGLPQAEQIASYLDRLEWNDATNREGHAAKVYFNALFGPGFTRDGGGPVNAALDYGYSVILSAINREISAAGYLNQLGIAHENTYNPFNLGCDFIEPLRPLVDAAVVEMQPDGLGRGEKMELAGLLNREVLYGGKRQHLMYALRLYCAGLFRALESGDAAEMQWICYE